MESKSNFEIITESKHFEKFCKYNLIFLKFISSFYIGLSLYNIVIML